MPTTKATKATKAPIAKKEKKVTTPKKVVAVKPVVTEIKKETKLVKYHNKNLKISPRKLRFILPAVKKLRPEDALKRLSLTNTNAARLLAKSVETVIADAKNNHHLNPDTISFDTIRVDEGLKIKRMDKSHGSRYARGVKIKRHSRLEIILKGEIK